jgi:hypothetical protein
MDNKNTVSGILISLALLTSVNAGAECYTRSSTVSKLTSSIEQIADVDRKVLSVSGGKNLCRITFRAYIDGKWHTAQGEETGGVNDSLDNICAKALNSGRVSILESVSGTRITGSQELICTDEPKLEQKTSVTIGDLVWESEVQVHPAYRDVFRYRGSFCKWFIESKPNIGKVDMHQGIICRSPDQKVWRVVDKW